jgi:hypothetical protein
MLDKGVFATIKELALHKRVRSSHVGRVLRLTLLAPELVEAILDGRQSAVMGLDGLLAGFPLGVGGAAAIFLTFSVLAFQS